MDNYIKKFEAVQQFDINKELKEYDLSISDLDKAIDALAKYDLDSVLLEELKILQSNRYKTLRKWKIDSFIKRYDNIRPLLDEIILIEDYLLELTDAGYKLFISSRDKKIEIEFDYDSINAIKKINFATKQLLELSHRLKLEFLGIQNTSSDSRWGRQSHTPKEMSIVFNYTMIN